MPKKSGAPDDRQRIDQQTRRNLEGLTLESEGRIDESLALYEQNIAEGFEGDWPYGRLVMFYEKRNALDDAARVLERGIEVFTASRRRTASDRRAVLRAFKGRLKEIARKRDAGA
jgi:hypothetical protein